MRRNRYPVPSFAKANPAAFTKVVLATLVLTLLALSATSATAQVTVKPPSDAATQKFEALSYDVLSPQAATLRLVHHDPPRILIDRQVDNEADFNAYLATKPDSVTLVTTIDDLLGRHQGFLDLAASRDVNIMVAAFGKLDELQVLVLDALGVPLADRITPANEAEGMVIVQYLRDWNFGYLIGDSGYHRGSGVARGNLPFKVDFGGFSADGVTVDGTILDGGPWWLELLRAALEEPFWNKMHYLSGHTLGCLGVDWWTALKILYRWEVFEQQWGFGEDMWGVIWDLIWGMTGYLDGRDGWLPD